MAFLDNISNNATTAGEQGLASLASTPGLQGPVTPGPGPKTLEFPLDLNQFLRPVIRFACTPNDPSFPITSISLPIPRGLSFADSATYDVINMGTIAAGAEIMKVAEKEGIGQAVGKAKNQFFSGGAIGAGIIAARSVGMDKTAQVMEFSSRQVVNPRTNTAFQGNQLRNFSFDFKMIGKSPAEVRQIDRIQNAFRDNLYASELGGEKTMLKYPSLWTITFLDPVNGFKELEYVPKIYTCYCTSVNTTVNSSSNTYRKDMSPYEIDVSLSFQESKILTRNEIEDLEINGNRENSDNAYIREKEQQLLSTQQKLAKEYATEQRRLKTEEANKLREGRAEAKG